MTVADPPRTKFSDPNLTVRGEPRARVVFDELKTLWINTGTLCNITCTHCYIESSPTNDSLVYFTEADLAPFLDEVAQLVGKPIEIGFTGGEPFLNPQIIGLSGMSLARGHRVLILTNAMRPMMRRVVSPRRWKGSTGWRRRALKCLWRGAPFGAVMKLKYALALPA
jgi:hypothetical protein